MVLLSYTLVDFHFYDGLLIYKYKPTAWLSAVGAISFPSWDNSSWFLLHTPYNDNICIWTCSLDFWEFLSQVAHFFFETHDNFFHIIIMVVDFFCINFDFSFFWFFFVLGQCDSFFTEVVKTLGVMLLSSLRNHDSYTFSANWSLNTMFPNFINFISIGPISPFLVFVNTNFASYIKLIYLKNSL